METLVVKHGKADQFSMLERKKGGKEKERKKEENEGMMEGKGQRMGKFERTVEHKQKPDRFS